MAWSTPGRFLFFALRVSNPFNPRTPSHHIIYNLYTLRNSVDSTKYHIYSLSSLQIRAVLTRRHRVLYRVLLVRKQDESHKGKHLVRVLVTFLYSFLPCVCPA